MLSIIRTEMSTGKGYQAFLECFRCLVDELFMDGGIIGWVMIYSNDLLQCFFFPLQDHETTGQDHLYINLIKGGNDVGEAVNLFIKLWYCGIS